MLETATLEGVPLVIVLRETASLESATLEAAPCVTKVRETCLEPPLLEGLLASLLQVAGPFPIFPPTNGETQKELSLLPQSCGRGSETWTPRVAGTLEAGTLEADGTLETVPLETHGAGGRLNSAPFSG